MSDSTPTIDDIIRQAKNESGPDAAALTVWIVAHEIAHEHFITALRRDGLLTRSAAARQLHLLRTTGGRARVWLERQFAGLERGGGEDGSTR